MNIYIKPAIEEQIKAHYVSGLSANEIKNKLQLLCSVRQLQRWIKAWGLSRTASDGFRLAVARGKVPYHYKPRGREIREGI